MSLEKQVNSEINNLLLQETMIYWFSGINRCIQCGNRQHLLKNNSKNINYRNEILCGTCSNKCWTTKQFHEYDFSKIGIKFGGKCKKCGLMMSTRMFNFYQNKANRIGSIG